MASRTIHDPQNYSPESLLMIIESDSESFTTGRRNNDMVNWFIAKRLIDLKMGEQPMARRFNDVVDTYCAELRRWQSDRATSDQDQALADWETSIKLKIETLAKHYLNCRQEALYSLWLPMDYNV